MLEKINWTALNDYYNIKNHYNDKVVWFFSVRSYVSIDNVVVVTSMLLCVCVVAVAIRSQTEDQSQGTSLANLLARALC